MTFPKVAVFGGGGVRTPLVIHGLARAQQRLGLAELALFDIDARRANTIATIGREIVCRLGADFRITVSERLESAAEGAAVILSSIRVGGMPARARDERIAIEHGLAGQETTGAGGAAMALRTVPVAVEQARRLEKLAPGAWLINFTNPAGLITQAITQNTGLKAIGICDTPIELFHRIAWALGEPYEQMTFEYAGLNHLGWVRRVTFGGEDITGRLLADHALLRRLYPADLFDPALIETLGLIPTEYLFFYYSQRKAHRNQLLAGASRGEELEKMNTRLFERLAGEDGPGGLEVYVEYLLRRNSSYMKLEAQAESAFEVEQDRYDPFETATGYHVIALDVMTALASREPKQVVANLPNDGAIPDLRDDDVVELPCEVDCEGARPARTGPLPDSVRGLVQSVKEYERLIIRAALERSGSLARLAMMENPMICEWELAGELCKSLGAGDPEHLGYLT